MDEHGFASWMVAPPPRSDILASLRELNGRFLRLAAPACRLGTPAALATLSAEQLVAAADCPYALFDLRFDDEAHWLERLRAAAGWRVADAPDCHPEVLDFTRLALFYAWHVATTEPLRAAMLLGMRAGTVAAFARQSVDRLAPIAAAESPYLAIRWQACEPFWGALIAAAARAEPRQLRRAQLRGIQFAAAARLTGQASRAGPADPA